MFENITTDQGLPSDYVYACCEDVDGYLWVGTNKGLCRFNGKLWELRNIDNNLPGNYVSQIVADKKFGIWIHIEEKGYYFFDTQTYQTYKITQQQNETLKLYNEMPLQEGIYVSKNNILYKIYFDAKKKCLIEEKIATLPTHSLIIPNAKKILQFANTDILENKKDFVIRKVEKNWLQNVQTNTNNYVASYEDIFYVDEAELKKINKEILFPKGKGKMCITQTKELCYIACNKQGIIELDTFGNITRFNKNDGMNNLSINQLFVAKDGTVYASTMGGGINVLYSSKRTKIKSDNGPIKEIVLEGNNFFAIDKSNLVVIDEDTKIIKKIALPFLPTCLLIDKEIIIGSMDGISFYTLNGNRLSLTKFISASHGISSIIKHNNEIYCSSYGSGIGKISNNKIVFKSVDLPFNNIEKIVSLKNGIAALSYENGFYITNNNIQLQQYYSIKNGLLDNSVYCVFEQDNTLWVGCKKGLSKIEQNKPIKNYTTNNGFKGNKVLNIGVQYNLLFLVISDKYIQQLVNDTILPLTNNALQMTDSYATTSSLIDTKLSEVLIGDNQGLQILNLEEFQPEVDVTIPMIQSIKINNEKIDTNSAINLSYSFKRFEIKLSPLNGLIFNRNEILYKLDNGEWQKINDTLTIGFNNLRPGIYNLYLKSVNSFGIESKVYLIKSFTVNRPWWLQWWFLILSIITIGFIMYRIFNYFTKQKLAKQLQEIKLQQELESERQRISRDLHDNMGAYTSALIANVQKVKNSKMQEEDFIQMQTNAESILGSLRETIWVLNNKSISIHELNDQFKNYVFKILKNFDNISFEAKETIEKDAVLTSVTALHIHKILQEVIQNIIKHSKATKINYTITSNEQISFKITDNGVGFNVDENTYGNGLENMAWRAKEVGIDFKIESIIGNGTSTTLNLI